MHTHIELRPPKHTQESEHNGQFYTHRGASAHLYAFEPKQENNKWTHASAGTSHSRYVRV